MKNFLIKLIKLYQVMPLSTHNSCKFIPSCSNYAIDALNKYVAFKGSIITI